VKLISLSGSLSAYMTITQTETLGARVKSRRISLGLTKAELARRVTAEGKPCAIQNISQVESGRVKRITYLAELARALQCDASWLQDGRSHSAPAPQISPEVIRELCKRHGVRRLDIFGSAARGSDFDPVNSDLDFLVEFDPSRAKPWMGEFNEFQLALEAVFRRKVDLISFGALAQMRNQYRRAAIEADRKNLYAA
jgi:predicted nucleotidyltransferase